MLQYSTAELHDCRHECQAKGRGVAACCGRSLTLGIFLIEYFDATHLSQTGEESDADDYGQGFFAASLTSHGPTHDLTKPLNPKLPVGTDHKQRKVTPMTMVRIGCILPAMLSPKKRTPMRDARRMPPPLLTAVT
jgi:hypothetical protein